MQSSALLPRDRPRPNQGLPAVGVLNTGLFEQQSIGLYYYGARWYDPYITHFSQPDRLIPDKYNPLDWDRCQYSRSNPVKYNDPTGHSVSVPGDSCALIKCLNDSQLIAKLKIDHPEFKDLPWENLERATIEEIYNFLDQLKANLKQSDIGSFEFPNDPNLTLLEEFHSWKYAPLFTAAMNLVTGDALILMGPGLLSPQVQPHGVAIYIGLYLFNRGSAGLGLAATGYQYSNGLNGTTSYDMTVSWTTLLAGAAPTVPIVPVVSYNISFAYTLYRTWGFPSP